MAAEPPQDPLGRVEAFLDVINRAHIVIFAQHRRVLDLGRDQARARDLLQASAGIVFREAPAAARRARIAAQNHAIGELLDPGAPIDDAALNRAVREAEMALAEMLQRQQQFADEMSTIIERDPIG